MKIRRPIETPSTREAAESLQSELAREVHTGQKFGLVTGVQVRYFQDETMAVAIAATLSTSNWSIVEKQQVQGTPMGRWEGCEGFREAPLMIEALLRLRNVPDVIFVRGAGRAHPRKFGVACHLGLMLEIPTIGVDLLWPEGCTKTGVMLNRGPKKRGFRTGLLHEATKELVGHELRTQDQQDPVFVSPGHRLDLDACTTMVLQASKFFRMPEPLRRAE